jgi:hypothetical protein
LFRLSGRVGFRLQAVQKIDGALGLRSCGEYRPLVSLQNLEPVAQVRRMIGSRLGRDAEVSAEERSAEFGNQFLGGVGVIAEPFPQDTR